LKGAETKGLTGQWDQHNLLMHHHLKFELIRIKPQSYPVLQPTSDWQTGTERYKVEMEIGAREVTN